MIIFLLLVCWLQLFQYNELQVIKSNVESAISKGIDPIAVRCAYANERDVVCVAYGSNKKSQDVKLTTK
jgi:hypothetical protein